MGKEKLLPISLLCLAVALVMSSVIISRGITDSAKVISENLWQVKSVNNASPTIVANKDTMSSFEAAEYLYTNQELLIQDIENKKLDIPYVKINDNYVFSKNAINKWLETKHTTGGN